MTHEDGGLLPRSLGVQLFLTILAGGGLCGCFLVTFGLDLAGRGGRGSRRLARPRRSTLRYELD